MKIIRESKISNFHYTMKILLVNAKLLIAINYSIFKFFQKIKMD
jgi:hypothetical protein